MTAIYSATQRWFSPISMLLMQLTLKLEQNDFENKQESFTTSQICTTLLLGGRSLKCNITFGAAVGPRRRIADVVVAKADVIRAMHEPAQFCQGPQTEFALIRESLGASRADHIFSVYGHIPFWKTFDEVGQGSLEKALSRIY